MKNYAVKKTLVNLLQHHGFISKTGFNIMA